MKVHVRFFASLRESLGISQLDLEVPDQARRQELMHALCSTLDSSQYETLSTRRTSIAINQELTRDDFVLADKDEIAFMPPITGG